MAAKPRCQSPVPQQYKDALWDSGLVMSVLNWQTDNNRTEMIWRLLLAPEFLATVTLEAIKPKTCAQKYLYDYPWYKAGLIHAFMLLDCKQGVTRKHLKKNTHAHQVPWFYVVYSGMFFYSSSKEILQSFQQPKLAWPCLRFSCLDHSLPHGCLVVESQDISRSTLCSGLPTIPQSTWGCFIWPHLHNSSLKQQIVSSTMRSSCFLVGSLQDFKEKTRKIKMEMDR